MFLVQINSTVYPLPRCYLLSNEDEVEQLVSGLKQRYDKCEIPDDTPSFTTYAFSTGSDTSLSMLIRTESPKSPQRVLELEDLAAGNRGRGK